MAHKQFLFIALGMMAAASPAAASTPEPAELAVAPAASPEAKYCIRVEPNTGSRIETVECYTRWDWSLLGVDIDKEWAKEGVRIVEPGRGVVLQR